MEENHSKHKTDRRNWLAVVIVLVILAVTTITAFILAGRQSSPVPENIKKAVSYPIYYPDQAKLPAGYRLDTNSFTHPIKNGVNYTVVYGNNKKLVFSLQPKPSDTDLQNFSTQYLPLRVAAQTSVGQADIGVYHDRLLVSLPTVNGPWIIITGPKDTNQSNLTKVLQSLKS